MPFEKGHKLSVGNKGGGRGTANYEKVKRLAISKAWDKVERNIDKKDVVKVALPVALRDMTDKNEISGDINVVLNISKDIAEKHGITSETSTDSKGQT